jgi:sugar-specific transcriptional regulator TrmB
MSEPSKIEALEQRITAIELAMKGNPEAGVGGLLAILQRIETTLKELKDDHEDRIRKLERGFYGDEENQHEGVAQTVSRLNETVKRAIWMISGAMLIGGGSVAVVLRNLASIIGAK